MCIFPGDVDLIIFLGIQANLNLPWEDIDVQNGSFWADDF